MPTSEVRNTSLFFILALSGLLAGCAAPTATPTLPAETPTPGIPGERTVILVNTETIHATFDATFTGRGPVAVILANSMGNDPTRWSPLVEALNAAENFTIVTYAYREEEGTHVRDTTALFDHLRTAGYSRIVCVGAGLGSIACSGLVKEPEMIGMVLMAGTIPAIEGDFPKLFVTADDDPYGFTGAMQRAFEQSSEPKMIKTYSAAVHGPGLFFKEGLGPQVLGDVMDFINGILNGE